MTEKSKEMEQLQSMLQVCFLLRYILHTLFFQKTNIFVTYILVIFKLQIK